MSLTFVQELARLVIKECNSHQSHSNESTRFHKKPGSRPINNSFLISYILALKFSSKFLDLLTEIVVKTKASRKKYCLLFCLQGLLAFMHIKDTVVDTFRSLEAKCVSGTMRDGAEISEVSLLFPCSSKSFLNFRLPSCRLLVNHFLMKRKRVC